MREEKEKVIQKEMDRLEHLGIIHKGLTSYSSPVVLVNGKVQIYTKFAVTFAYSMRN